MTEEHPRVAEARKRLRCFQMQHGPRITPRLSTLFGIQWNSALERDPEGGCLSDLIDSWEELVTPMAG